MVVLLIASGFCLYRSSAGFVWDDSPHLTANLYDSDSPLLWGTQGCFKRILTEAFGTVTHSGYRPLSAFINLLGVSLFSNHDGTSPYLWFFCIGLILALLCISMYYVCCRYLKTKLWAVIAVFLFVFSTPVISASWVVFAGIQALVPLVICVGLILYWKIAESQKSSFFFTVILYLLLFWGPWLREFVGFLSLLIIFLEAKHIRRPSVLMGISFLFFVHALFPTFLVKVFIFHELPLRSIFSLGLLGAQINSSSNRHIADFVHNLFSSIRMQVPYHFLTLLPPMIVGLVLLDYLLSWFKDFRNLGAKKTVITDKSIAIIFYKKWVTPLNNTYLPICFTILIIWGIIGGHKNDIFYLLLCLIFPLQGMRKDIFLSLWVILLFIPFLWVFTEQVHLAYALLPAAIITAVILESIYLKLYQNFKRNRSVIYLIPFFVFMIIGLLDHGLNLYGSYKVTNEIENGICSVSNWIKNNIPKNSVIVTNAMHVDDMRYYTNNQIRVYYTVQAGIARDEDGIAIDPRELERILEDNHGKREIYFLDVNFNYTPDKVNYHAHKYVRNKSVATIDLGVVHITKAVYPYFDPFKVYVRRAFISFLGPPDLENDFYRGRSQDGTSFLYEVYTEYHVYRVMGTDVDPWDPGGNWVFVEEGYKGFNLFQRRGQAMALAQSAGRVDISWMESSKVREMQEACKLFLAPSIEAVKKKIDNFIAAPQQEVRP